MSQVQRSACSGVRRAGAVQPKTCLTKRYVVLDVEAPQVGPPADVDVGGAGPRPPQPQGLLCPGSLLRQVLDRDVDHAAARARRRVGAGPASTALEPGVQAMPGLHAQVA